MKYLSLFSGIGGFEYAIHQLFPDAECVGYSEIDKYAIQTYQKNFPTHANLGDITQIDINALPDFDLLVGGSPCQDLSIAKAGRKGLEGGRSGLFYTYLEILRVKKPKYFILENVASMKKEARDKISAEIGLEPIMINAALVSAQNRKRYYWTNIPGIQQPSDRGIVLKDILEDEVDEKYNVSAQHTQAMINTRKSKKLNTPDIESKCGTLTASYYKIPNDGNYIKVPDRIGHIGRGGQGDRIYSQEGKSINLSASGGGTGAKTGLYCVAQRGRYKEDGTTEQKLEARNDGKTNVLTTVQKDNMVAQYGTIRKLTPTECERLQCFPDGRTEGVSNTQRYKQLGNAVNTEVIKHIVSYIK